MLSYIVRRLVLMPITLIGITVMVFLIARLAPGRPGQMQLADASMDAETQQAMAEWYERRYGLNKPLYMQYINWWKGLVTKDLQAEAWYGESPLRPVFTQRVAETELYFRSVRGAWYQVTNVRQRLPIARTKADEFAESLPDQLRPFYPQNRVDYEEPSHLLLDADTIEIESLDADLAAERLERAHDVQAVTRDIEAPAWSDKGEELFLRANDSDHPVFARDGIWYEIEPNNRLENTSVYPITDSATLQQILGSRFETLPQREEGYAIPHHAVVYGSIRQLDGALDQSTLKRLYVRTRLNVPSTQWVEVPGTTDEWGILVAQSDENAQPILLVQTMSGTWERLIGASRAAPIAATIFRQDSARLRSQWSAEIQEAYPAEDEGWMRVPRHAVLSGTLVPYHNEVIDRDIRPYQHKSWKWELTLGESMQSKLTVMQELSERLPRTLLINLLAFPLIYALAIPIGMLMAVKRGKNFDAMANVTLLGFWSIPTVLSATLLIGYLSQGGAWMEWFPNNGLSSVGAESWPFVGYRGEDGLWVRGWLEDRVWHVVLPVVCITYGGLAYLAKQMRAAMLDNFTMDYVRTARAKGVKQKDIVFRHVLRNSLLPIITIFALILPVMIAGSVIIEKIFSIQGMGLLLLQAVQSRDYDVVQSLALIAGALNLTGLLLADICYAMADPRITYR